MLGSPPVPGCDPAKEACDVFFSRHARAISSDKRRGNICPFLSDALPVSPATGCITGSGCSRMVGGPGPRGIHIYRFKTLMSTVSRMLSTTIDVMGIKILLRSVSILISPGNLPNQLISQGAKCRAVPMATNTSPAVIIQRPIISLHSFSTATCGRAVYTLGMPRHATRAREYDRPA